MTYHRSMEAKSTGRDITNMPIQIHGNEYFTVAERVQEAHKDQTGSNPLSITTEVLYQNPVVIKATVVTKKGTFTGISAANPNKAIEKMSPYEVAETSAVGRALGFAGYGMVDSIASADEMKKAAHAEKDPTDDWETPYNKLSDPIVRNEPKDLGKCPKCGAPMAWSNKSNKPYCSKLCWTK